MVERQPKHPLNKQLEGRHIVLGSKSPRRVELLRMMGLDFEVRPSDADELCPAGTPLEEVALYLAILKQKALLPTLQPKELLITADTTVLLNEQILGKPTDSQDAQAMLRKLSGHTHKVITGYTITLGEKREEILYGAEQTLVTFRELTEEEIDYYTHHSLALDKAGSYGIQDWIGLVGVQSIQGSYTNVMGLPTLAIYQTLSKIKA